MFVYHSKIFATPAITPIVWVFLAATKILMALSYHWLHIQIPTFFDSYFYFREGNIVFSAMQESPWYYLQLMLLPNNYFPEPEHLCDYIDAMGLWYDRTGYTIVRVNAFFRLFSFGFLSIHFVFFSFLSFIGAFYLYKFFAQTTTLSEYIIIGVIFFIPGVAFWTSGLHKEALVLFSIGIVIYNTYQLTIQITARRLFLMLIFFLFLIHVRMYMLLVIVPALAAYFWNEKTKIKTYIPYLLGYGSLTVTLVTYDILAQSKERLAYKISEFQRTYINAFGNTNFETEIVSNSWKRIFIHFPEHFLNAFIHPLYNQCITNWCRLYAFLSLFLSLFLIVSLFKVKYRYLIRNNVALFCLSIGLVLMSIIGVVVSNAGAIVRYRSIAVLFLVMGLFLSFQKTEKKI